MANKIFMYWTDILGSKQFLNMINIIFNKIYLVSLLKKIIWKVWMWNSNNQSSKFELLKF